MVLFDNALYSLTSDLMLNNLLSSFSPFASDIYANFKVLIL